MSVNLQEAIQEQTRALFEEEMRQVLQFIHRLRQQAPQPQSLGELIDECFQDVPPDVMAQLPADAAANHDKARHSARAKSISAVFEELSNQVPLKQWSQLPADGAENHDHYLYGAPKKIR